MSLFRRIKNIIRSNISFSKTEPELDIDINSYEDIYYEDSSSTELKENSVEKRYYEVLELEYGADFDKIKSAYRRLLKKYHPDLFQNRPEKLKTAQEVTRQINEAYTYFERKFL